MNTDQLQYLIDIAKTGSINTTAKRLYTSQPAISESIKKLENELNCTILKRSKRGVELTLDGRYMLKHAIPILEHYEQMLQYKEQDPSPHGVLSIGVATAITNTLLEDLIIKMQEYCPRVSLYTYEASYDEILDACKNGTVDFGLFGATPVYREAIERYSETVHMMPLFQTPLVCVMTKNNPAATLKTVRFHEESPLKFTIYNYSEFFSVSGVSCLHISSNAEIHKKFMCEQNTGCVIPKYFADRLFTESKFITLPLADVEPSVYYLAYHKKKNVDTNEVFHAFIQSVSELTQDLT